MADIGQVLANNSAVVGVIVGTLLGYALNALNRRHQEAREDRTRWYDARLKAYADFSVAAFEANLVLTRAEPSEEIRKGVGRQLVAAGGALRLLGSPSVRSAATAVLQATVYVFGPASYEQDFDEDRSLYALSAFEHAARADLGFPSAS